MDNKEQDTKVRSIFVEGREYFDKTYGNSYFSARVSVNGDEVFIMNFQYGYGDHYKYMAKEELSKRGYLPSGIDSTSCRDLGIDFYSSISRVKKSEMFKEWRVKV